MGTQDKQETSGRRSGGTLKGKVVIVTGASKGIGRAIGLRLAREGGKLVLAARDAKALGEVAGEIESGGGTAVSFAADLRDSKIPAALVDAALHAHGALDVVVNNAGATRRGDFLQLSDADWLDGFALKFFGAVRLVRAAWPHLKSRHGAVLNIIGVGGRTPDADFTIGGSVNGACLSFTKALAQIGLRDGVRVNAINPGWIRTGRLDQRLEQMAAERGGTPDTLAEELVRQADIARLGTPEDIGNLAAFVLSPEGSLLHGSLIDMDAGRTKTV
jgi:NAD(P)-dependent dehydrogenase (short-subunit alcohol dehydrogenase family)